MLSIESIAKGFGDQMLFEDASLQINPGERVGLVGRNGHGKTTLLNMIAGFDHPDEGTISCPTGYRLGILPQKIQFSLNTVRDEAMTELPSHEQDQYWRAEKSWLGWDFQCQTWTGTPISFPGDSRCG